MTLSADTAGFDSQRVVACACSGNLFATLGVSPSYLHEDTRAARRRPPA
jgi:hypothetical protein